jgi:soluble lytic murein transglycosylase-like protein
MAIAGVLGIIAIFGAGLAGLALLVALRTTGPANAAPPVATPVPAPAAPVVAFVIQMDQPMPTRAANVPNTDGAVQVLPQNPADVTPEIPVVSADQVTAPGQPTPMGQKPLRPLMVTTPSAQASTPQANSAAPKPANKGNMTYGQMFKEVASHYDLDWRLLAAQAYLESGFDSMAVSDKGYLGLMQIHPNTWGEWAPKVNVSDPYDAYSNVLVGAAYLNYLRTLLSARGLPQQQWMLVAYNWGPEKLFAHLDSGGKWDTLDAEVRQYADDVLRIAATIPQ